MALSRSLRSVPARASESSAPKLPCKTLTVIKGDQTILSVAAASVVATLPVVALAFAFQRRIVEGLTAGAVKG